MVTFKEDRFIIEVETVTNPIEDWLSLHDEILNVLMSEDEAMKENRPKCLSLLRDLMPDYETAIKMTV